METIVKTKSLINSKVVALVFSDIPNSEDHTNLKILKDGVVVENVNLDIAELRRAVRALP